MDETQERAATSQAPEDLIGSTLGRFVVRSRLGRGGMGEVYRADDPLLKRSVAIKRLAPFLGGDPRLHQRLLREGERASALNHPHVAAVYDVLKSGNELFLVMEYVEGTTLRDRLRQGAFSVPEFLPLAIQCAEALEAAHARDILHGDIKPENIMLTPSGGVKILDFGVARRLPSAAPGAVTQSVQSWGSSIAGTPAYMAPEVILSGAADARADLFSLGVVFYEALAGRHPFAGEQGTLDRLLHQDPEPLSRVNPEVPAGLEEIVTRMLAKKPEARYGSARQVAEDLHAVETGARPKLVSRRPWPRKRVGIALATAVLLLVAAALPGVRRKVRGWVSGPIPERRDLAVLPFSVVGSDPETKSFADGLTDTVTAKLSQLTGGQPLDVVAAEKVRNDRVTDADGARREYGVNLVLEGSLHRSGDAVRVVEELVDARTHRQLRADIVTASFSDGFAVEDKVVNAAVGMLDLEPGPADRQTLEAHGTTEPTAYDLYLQGRGYLRDYQKPENLESAVIVFRHALERDPKYALAFAGLGEAYWRKYGLDKDRQWIDQAREACGQAVKLDERASEGHICLGHLDEGTGWHKEAAQEYQRAIELEPTNDDAYDGLADAYEGLGKPDLAESTYRKAISLRPNYWAPYNRLGIFYFDHGRFSEAEQMLKRVVALAPDNWNGYSNLGGVYVDEGRWADAISMFQRSASIRPNSASSSNLGVAYFSLRRFEEAVGAFQEATRLDPHDYEVWGNLADAESWVAGRQTKAREHYRQALNLAGGALQVNPREAMTLSYEAWYHAALGERSAALESLRRALAASPREPPPELSYNAALVCNQLGQTREALRWVGEAAAAGFAPIIESSPYFDGLRKRPQFQQLLKKS